MASAILNLVHANRFDIGQRSMNQSPTDTPLNGSIHARPACAENLGSFLPAEALAPVGQEQFVRVSHVALALSPRHSLDNDTLAVPTIDASRRVKQKHSNIPQRHERELSLRLRVVGSTWLAAPIADWLGVGAWLYDNFNSRRVTFD